MSTNNISYDEVAYVKYLRKLERRAFAKPIIRKWCKICNSKQSNLVMSEFKLLEKSLNDLGIKLQDQDPDGGYKFAKHRAEIRDRMEDQMRKRLDTETRYNKARAEFTDRAKMTISGSDSENIRIESRIMKIYAQKVRKELTQIDQKVFELGRDWFNVPVEGEVRRLVDKIHKVEAEKQIAINVIRQKKVLGKVDSDHLLSYLSPKPYKIKEYSLRLIDAIIEFTSSEDNKKAKFLTQVDGERAFLNFVKKEAHFSIEPRSVYDRIIRCFAQLDDVFDDREFEKPEFNVGWYFDRRSQIVRLRYDVERLLKIGSIRLE